MQKHFLSSSDAPRRIVLCLLLLPLLAACSSNTPVGNQPAPAPAPDNGASASGVRDPAPDGPAGKGGTSTIETRGGDNLTLTADLYDCGDAKAPILLLFHQARGSRGEYTGIAPRLVKLGYNCLALDARSGKGGGKWELVNQTAKRAADAGLATGYLDAKADLLRSISWVRELGYTGKIALWGSSYSAALTLVIGGSRPAEVSALLVFSPGEFLNAVKVAPMAAKINIPTFLTGPAGERAVVQELGNSVPAASRTVDVQEKGVHGSSTLFRADDSERTWKRVEAFLAAHLK